MWKVTDILLLFIFGGWMDGFQRLPSRLCNWTEFLMLIITSLASKFNKPRPRLKCHMSEFLWWTNFTHLGKWRFCEPTPSPTVGNLQATEKRSRQRRNDPCGSQSAPVAWPSGCVSKLSLKYVVPDIDSAIKTWFPHCFMWRRPALNHVCWLALGATRLIY